MHVSNSKRTREIQSDLLETALATEILRYFARHPDSKDTLEGIARYWIVSQRIESWLHEVERVLSTLVQAGYIRKKPVIQAAENSSEYYYELNQERLEDLREFLK